MGTPALFLLFAITELEGFEHPHKILMRLLLIMFHFFVTIFVTILGRFPSISPRGDNIIYMELCQTFPQSLLDLFLAYHTIMLVICFPVITEGRIQILIVVPVPHRIEVRTCLPCFAHSEGREVLPELLCCGQSCLCQICIPAAVIGCGKYRRQIHALVHIAINGRTCFQPVVDVSGDCSVGQQIVDRLSGALRSREHPVLGQDSLLRSGIIDRLDAVPLAYIHAQIDHGTVCSLADRPLATPRAVADLDRDRLVVVPGTAGSPRTILFQHALPDLAIIADAIVGRCFSGRRHKTVGNALCGAYTCSVMYGDLTDRRRSSAVIPCQIAVLYQTALAHFLPPPRSSFSDSSPTF